MKLKFRQITHAMCQVGKGGFHPSGAAPLGTPGLPPLSLNAIPAERGKPPFPT